jgi:predicted ATPase/DNA-binding CsgD family transcriptional regulator
MGDFDRGAAIDQLTERELEILRLVADGLSNQSIATRLVVSPETVKWHVKQIYGKLNVGKRTQAVARARASGLLLTASSKTRLSPPKHNLPQPLTPFVGRVEELTTIAHLLADPACRLLTLVGPGGIGKTRLALQAGEQQLLTFTHGVYFVSLAPLSTPEALVPRIAEAVCLDFYPGGEPRVQLLDFLRTKQMLLVLDNFEHLLAGASLIADMLESAPHIKILITSRERLNMQAETIFAIDGLHYPSQREAHDVAGFTAVKLFLQTASQVQADFPVTAYNLQSIANICRLVHGVPLAILLAAAWVGTLSVEEINQEIQKSLDFLEIEQSDVPERQRSLRTAFVYSWKLLTENERRVYRRLAVFRGSFTREAAEQITGASLKTLMALVNKSLVRYYHVTRRYQMHPLSRQYAAEKLIEASEEEVIQQRHFDFFAALAEDGEPKFHSKDIFMWRERFDADYDNLREALSYALTHADRLQAGLRLVSDLAWFWMSTHRLQEGREWTGKLLGHPGAVSATRERGMALYGAGLLSFFWGDISALRVCVEEGEHIAQRVGDRRLLGQTLYAHAALEIEERKPAEALPFALESAALLEEVGGMYLPAALQTVGRTYFSLGKDATAMSILEECLALAMQGEYLWIEAINREVLVPLLVRMGKPLEAVNQLQRVTQFWETLGDKTAYIRVQRELVEFYIAQGSYEEAFALQHERLALCRDLGLDRLIADGLLILGKIARLRQAEGEATACFEESLNTYRQLGNQAGVEACLAALKATPDSLTPDYQ